MFALLLTLLALCVWLHQDADRRQMNSPMAWVVAVCLVGPLALAMYWSRRPLFTGEHRSGGRIWVMVRAFVIALTAWMILFAAVFAVWLSALMPGVVLVGIMGALLLFFGGFWFLVALGLLLAAFLFRDAYGAEVGPTHAALRGVAPPRMGDRLLRVIFLGGLLAVFIFTEPATPDWMEEVQWETVPERIQI